MGPGQFEHMVQALTKAELGNGVRPFGSGRDGQRDATFRGRVNFPVGAGTPWDGYGVIQIKHREKPGTNDGAWFLNEVRGEIKGWIGKKRLDKETPQFLLFATNVSLSGVEESGGKDKFERLMENSSGGLGLQGWFVWDYNEIRTMLDRHTSIRQRYLEQIVTGDLLAALTALLPAQTALQARKLAGHAVNELITKQWVRTGDAGYNDTSKVRLADMAIDLPCHWRKPTGEPTADRHTAAQLTIKLGDQDSPAERDAAAIGVVLVGGPGQGKSTLAQLIAHAYRLAFLQDIEASQYGVSASRAISELRARLDVAGIPPPTRRRWPVLIELSKAGAALADSEQPFSLLSYIADSILVEGKPADPSALLDWMRSWPACVVLDGPMRASGRASSAP
jgi:hypothetical protein